jgi:hypothetical protein
MGYSLDVVVPEIAQGLSLFPNLHTIQLIFQLSYPRPQQFFSAFCYPKVHTLNLSRASPVVDVLLACPNTKEFSYYKDLGDPYYNGIRHLLSSRCAGGIEKLGVQPVLDVAGKPVFFPLFLNAFLTCSSYGQMPPSASRPLLIMQKPAKPCMKSFHMYY